MPNNKSGYLGLFAPAMDPAAESYSTSTTPLLLLGTLTLAVSLLLLIAHGRGKAPRLPPGPPGLLFLAKFVALRRSIFDLGPLIIDLHARHGPVISIHLFRTLIFVADRKMAHSALVQGGATFADRPPPVDPARLFTSGGRDINSASYGPYWRVVRRNLNSEALNPARVAHFAPARRSACDGLVSSLRREQERQGHEAVTLRPLLRRAMFDLLVFMCFGARLDREALDEMEALQYQVLLTVTTFPVFAFFPAVTKRLFHKSWAAYLALRRRQDEVFVPLIHAKRGDGGPPCYAESLLALRVGDGERLTDAEMVSLCSEFINAGTDTTVTLLEWIMAELVNRPDVQAKVYEEVKANPELKDLQAMPYLKAVVLEGLRLHPPGHFLLPHGVKQSGDAVPEIGGYTVPKGAEVNFLVAEIGRDESVWTAAREFRPERFLEGAEGHGVDITGSREIKMMPFGAGRRMCPGYSLGMHQTEYFVAMMVRELEWRPPVDGEEVDMTEMLDFTTVMKHPLRARVFART